MRKVDGLVLLLCFILLAAVLLLGRMLLQGE